MQNSTSHFKRPSLLILFFLFDKRNKLMNMPLSNSFISATTALNSFVIEILSEYSNLYFFSMATAVPLESSLVTVSPVGEKQTALTK